LNGVEMARTAAPPVPDLATSGNPSDPAAVERSVIVDTGEPGPPAPVISTGTHVLALTVALVLGIATLASMLAPDPAAPPTPSATAAASPLVAIAGPHATCADPSRSPMETVYRMFEMSEVGPTKFSECWTAGRAPADPQLTSYIHARRPLVLTVETVRHELRAGQLYVHIQMRARWKTDAPIGWANDAPRFVMLRQQPSGAWTIDEVRAEVDR
jgi:hypothetical protein